MIKIEKKKLNGGTSRVAAGKWIACGEQAKVTEYFNIFTTSTGVPAKHEPWPLAVSLHQTVCPQFISLWLPQKKVSIP